MLRTRSLSQDPSGNRTTRRPPDHGKESQTAVVWSCLPFIRSGQNHLERHIERGKKTRQTEEEVGSHKGMDRPGVHQVSEGSGEQGKMEKTGCKSISGVPTTLTIKGLMLVTMFDFITFGSIRIHIMVDVINKQQTTTRTYRA